MLSRLQGAYELEPERRVSYYCSESFILYRLQSPRIRAWRCLIWETEVSGQSKLGQPAEGNAEDSVSRIHLEAIWGRWLVQRV